MILHVVYIMYVGCSVLQAVFLDDLGVNLKSAKEVGISTIKVTDPVMALEELGSILGLTFSQASSKL